MGRRNDKRKLLRNSQELSRKFKKLLTPFQPKNSFFASIKANISKYNPDCTQSNYFNLLQINGLVKRNGSLKL